MNAEVRLNLINKIAQNGFFFDRGDEYWLIGMLSDTTMSDDKVEQEIEKVKEDFPEYIDYF